MRLRIAPPPTGQELLRRTPHELVRDFPETLAVFRAHEVRLPVVGARAVGRVVEEAESAESAGLTRDLREALEWRMER